MDHISLYLRLIDKLYNMLMGLGIKGISVLYKYNILVLVKLMFYIVVFFFVF